MSVEIRITWPNGKTRSWRSSEIGNLSVDFVPPTERYTQESARPATPPPPALGGQLRIELDDVVSWTLPAE